MKMSEKRNINFFRSCLVLLRLLVDVAVLVVIRVSLVLVLPATVLVFWFEAYKLLQ